MCKAPLWGGVRGGGGAILSQVAPSNSYRTTPLPNPPPQGGREQTDCGAGERTESAALICSNIAISRAALHTLATHAPSSLRPVGGVAGAGGGGAHVHLPARRRRRARDQGRAARGRLRALLRQARGAARSVCSLPPCGGGLGGGGA